MVEERSDEVRVLSAFLRTQGNENGANLAARLLIQLAMDINSIAASLAVLAGKEDQVEEAMNWGRRRLATDGEILDFVHSWNKKFKERKPAEVNNARVL